MKIQYVFHLFIRKYFITTCHNANIYLPHHYLRYIEMTDISMYNFFIVVLYTQFKVCFQNNRPS